MGFEAESTADSGANARAATSPGTRLLVALALVACWLTVLAPLSLIAAVAAAIAIVAGAAFVQLHTGGFEVGPFTICAWLGLGCAVVLIVGSWLARAGSAEGRTEHPFKRRVASLLGLGSVVTLLEWDGNAWLPDPLSSFLVLSGLFVLLAAVPLALVWAGVRLAAALYRWSRASAFVAGVVTTLAALLTVGSVSNCSGERPASSPDLPPAVRMAQKVLRTAVEAEGFSETMRAMLMETAATLDPEVFQRKRPALAPAKRSSPPALPATASAMPALPPAQPDPEVSKCLEEIVADRRTGFDDALKNYSQRVRSQHPFIPADEVDELVLDTMLAVCVAHDRANFRSLQAIFLTNLDHRAIDRSRRERRSCDVLAEFAACQLGDVDWMRDPELDALYSLLCAVKPDEKVILVLRSVLGASFAEIGGALGLAESKAREIFHNTRRRLKRQLEERCSPPAWGGL